MHVVVGLSGKGKIKIIIGYLTNLMDIFCSDAIWHAFWFTGRRASCLCLAHYSSILHAFIINVNVITYFSVL